jgi:NAD-dependent dihydropyrimidine dehydrogenase PreA subunit
MEEIYKQLAKKLDMVPAGFPATESGLELEILSWIFTPDEAAVALELMFEPETVETISKRLKKPVEETEAILEKMRENEQIMCFNIAGAPSYLLPPYYPGIHDCQNFRKDKTIEELQKYALLFDEYYPLLIKTAGYYKPALTRVVPVSTSVEPGLKIHRLDDVHRMMGGAKSIHLMDCVCRKEKAVIGKACNHSLEVCMMLSSQENIFSKWPHGRDISLEEAMKVIDQTEKEGLVHTTYNADDSGNTFLCACCPCCSIFLSGLVKFKAPYILTQSSFVSRIDKELCRQGGKCGICANERCPMDAVTEEENGYRVIPERCIGCGVCLSVCPTEAIALIPRPKDEMEEIPPTLQDWAMRRAAERWK